MILRQIITLFSIFILFLGHSSHTLANNSKLKTYYHCKDKGGDCKYYKESHKGTVKEQASKIHYKNRGIASWYSGKITNFNNTKPIRGQIYKNNRFTAAHKTLPMSSLLKVTNLKNNKSIIVEVNDRGPFIKGRIVDLSKIAAQALGFEKEGLTRVEVEYIGSSKKKV